MQTISGKIIHGDHLGKKQRYPTANFSRRVLVGKKLTNGVYSATTTIRGIQYRALVIIGAPSITRRTKGKVELYLIGFQGNLYNKKVTVTVFKKVRALKKFDSIELLRKQIQRDIAAAKKQILPKQKRFSR